ncbi:D-3-phosphoglycerate dehydrogenase family protein [Synechococcus sp. Minos11]|uniref:NAD(P)-dependent oxidoreductase n=1 Tax=Synechococcus sp. Minos11 TaxID=221341 RepID=UPI0016488B9F|nr:NAD(P)-dependent oxidoreductase [Synechococcus sp. Minos11]QNJ07688.1 D-3-phosphoglycerate dehydrogenase family protein [Synechococcus sp. Minos11]
MPITALATEPDIFSRSVVNNFLRKDFILTSRAFRSSQDLYAFLSNNSFDIVFARLGLYFGSDFFALAPSLKVLATPTTGLDHIDCLCAARNNVSVISLRGEVAFLRTITSTAEHAWLLLLACNRNLGTLEAIPQNSRWHRDLLELHQLSSQTIGIIGYGRIGTMLVNYARAFSMNILVCDPFVDSKCIPSFVKSVTLDDLLSSSDHVIMAASYSSGDPPIINKTNSHLFKYGSTFVNIARGELVDEDVLVQLLKTGIIRSAGLDVLAADSTWPPNSTVSSPLLNYSLHNRNVIITPHVAGYSVEAINSTRAFIIQQVNSFFTS